MERFTEEARWVSGLGSLALDDRVFSISAMIALGVTATEFLRVPVS